MATLITAHERALTLLFSELQSAAERQGEAFLGTPGALTERTNATGTRFWVHRYSDAAGRRQEVYLGKADGPAVTARVAQLRARIDAANSAIDSVGLLARAGFATVDRNAYATLAILHNHGVFRAGALLIGSHAYGALLNALGARAVAYATEDVDIARREQLALSGLPPFIDMPELGAHAKGLPYLAYLLGAAQEIAVLSPHGVVMVRVPAPERFAVHKLIVSQLRSRTSAKPEKDLRQAATLIEALADRFPKAVKEALGALPKGAVRYAARAIKALERHLPSSDESAWEELTSLRAR